MLRWTLLTVVAAFAGCSEDATQPTVDGTTGAGESQGRPGAVSESPDMTSVSENERYDNPLDQKTYVAKGGWNEYKPKVPRTAAETGRIHNGGIRLLTAQDKLAERTSVASLAAFIKRAEALAQTALSKVKTEATVLAQFTCTPGTHDVKLAHQGNITQEQLQTFYDVLLAMDALSIESGEVAFQLTIQIDSASQE